MKEEWRPVVGYEGLYEVSNIGGIRSLDRVVWRKNGKVSGWWHYKGKIMKQRQDDWGYIVADIYNDSGKRFRVITHRLVADAFIGDIPDKYVVNHKDGNKTNNIVDNLEIVTKTEDILHAYRTGLRKPKRWNKTNYANAKLTEGDVINIRSAPHISPDVLAKQYGVDRTTIWNIRTNKTWRDVRSF